MLVILKQFQLEHTTLLDARFDPASSQLFLLTSRTPLELSGRVLCAVPIQEIDNKLDTGSFLDYDEMVGCERKKHCVVRLKACIRIF